MIVNLAHVLVPARKQGYTIGAFNIYNLETISAVYRAASDLGCPVIFAFGEQYIEVANLKIIAAMVHEFAGRTTIPMVLHLDHCKSIDVIYKAVQAGFSSVMFDGSRLPFPENLAMTKKVVEFAHSVGVSVEAELGSVPFDHSQRGIPEEYLTRVDEAVQLVREAGIDALAVAIGTVHGEYKGRPKIYHDRLLEIADAVPVPLVLHGGSGVPEEDILRAIRTGISKINVNTQISAVAVKRIKELCAAEKPGHLSALLHEAEEVMVTEVKGYIRLFTDGKSAVMS
jgi:fructose-bisphosphate aldolase class II